MKVYEIIGMFVEENEQHIELWDNATEKIVFKGCYPDMPSQFAYSTITSIDNITDGTNGITLNIDIVD